MGLVLYMLLGVSSSVLAAPPDEDLQLYLQKLGWTKEDLTEYLGTYELSLEEFETMEDLVEVLGTPINESNVQNVLDSYGLSMDHLKELLAQFGETTEDYTFIEDLSKAVSFYIEHTEAMTGMSDFLSYVGVTDGELTRMFDHISKIEKGSLQAELQAINQRIDQLGSVDETNGLSEEQRIELLALFEDVMSIYQLNPTYQVSPVLGTSNETISYNQLTDIDSIDGRSVKVSLFTSQGNLLADMTLSSDMLASDFVIQASEQFAQVGQVASNMNSFMYGDLLPNTASSYLVNVLYGLILLVSGICLYLFTRKRAVF